VIIARLMKMAHFNPYKKTITGEETTRLFLNNIYRHHGLPHDNISYKEPQFIFKFWKPHFEILKVEIIFSSTLHRQINSLAKPSYMQEAENKKDNNTQR